MQILRLATPDLSVAIRPDKGASIQSIVDVSSGLEFLWQTPWRDREPGAHGHSSDSLTHWVTRDGGGWSLMLPNTGPERVADGAVWGFHGEAAVIPWRVEQASADRARLVTNLITAPLEVTRDIRVTGSEIVVIESVTNESPDDASIRWGHHPSYGAPFVEPGLEMRIPTATTEDGGGARDAWPRLGDLDLAVVPEEPRAVLAYLSDLAEGRYRLINRARGIGVEFSWPLEVFPYLWYWQELRASPGFPWFRRITAFAVEPHTAIPSSDPLITIAGGATITAELRLRVLRRPEL